MNACSCSITLAPRASALPASPIRALLNAHAHTITTDFGGGHPEPGLFPAAGLARAAERLLSGAKPAALEYAATEGHPDLRRFIAERLRRRGYDVSAEQVLVTSGSQHALCTVAQTLGAKGRVALLEQPGYPGAHQAFALAECTVQGLPVTRDGWELDVVARERPSLVYVIPHFQNPTGRLATTEQEQALASLAVAQDFCIVEDDAYGELCFSGDAVRPLVASCPTNGVLVGSFSKTLCPGLRLGYIAAPRWMTVPLSKTLQATTLQPGTLAQSLALELLTELDYEEHLRQIRALYQERANALSARCRALGLDHQAPRGGFFLWVETPDGASEVAKRAALSGVLAVPEAAFRLPEKNYDPGLDHHLRLAFSRYKDSDAALLPLKHALAAPLVL